MSRVSLSSEAELDFIEAFAWYAKRSHSAAENFASEFRKALNSIGETPQRFARYGKQHRSYLLHSYPYQLFYFEIDNDHCLIVAISHTSRRPNWWHQRALK